MSDKVEVIELEYFKAIQVKIKKSQDSLQSYFEFLAEKYKLQQGDSLNPETGEITRKQDNDKQPTNGRTERNTSPSPTD